jgi:hypothetical protein
VCTMIRRRLGLALSWLLVLVAIGLALLINRPLRQTDLSSGRTALVFLRTPVAARPSVIFLPQNYPALAALLEREVSVVCSDAVWYRAIAHCQRSTFVYVADLDAPSDVELRASGCLIGAPPTTGRADSEVVATVAREIARRWGASWSGKLSQFLPIWTSSSSNSWYLLDSDDRVLGVFCHLRRDASLIEAQRVALRCLQSARAPLPSVPWPGFGTLSDCSFSDP